MLKSSSRFSRVQIKEGKLWHGSGRLVDRAAPSTLLVPTLCVGTHVWTLCVPSTGNRDPGRLSRHVRDGERPDARVPTQCVGTSTSLRARQQFAKTLTIVDKNMAVGR